MGILDKKSELINRKHDLDDEIASIEDEIKILQCLENRAKSEITEIQRKLVKLDKLEKLCELEKDVEKDSAELKVVNI